MRWHLLNTPRPPLPRVPRTAFAQPAGLTTAARDALRTLSTGWQAVVLIGIGGSSLGARLLAAAVPTRCPLHVLDTLCEASLRAVRQLPPQRTLVIAVSKSGTTPETLTQLAALRAWHGRHAAGRTIVVTDCPDSPLGCLAGRRGWPLVVTDARVGGRFGIFTDTQMLPVAAAGLPVSRAMQAAQSASPQLARAASLLLIAARGGGLTICVDQPAYRPLADWLIQLIAESLGKAGSGCLPTASLLPRDRHCLLQLWLAGPSTQSFVVVSHCRAHNPCQRLADIETGVTIRQLTGAGRSLLSCRLDDRCELLTLAQAFLQAVPRAAIAAGIDHDGQPQVQSGKSLLHDALANI